MNVWTQFKQDWSFSAMLAGLLAVVISYSGPLVIIFQVGQQAGVSSSMMISWIWAISIGSAITSIFLSLRYKVPVILAWSIPGTALLMGLFPQLTLNEMVGAYIITAVITLIIGLTGYFDKLLQWIPQGVASGMMAGILFQFGVSIFQSVHHFPALVLAMLLSYIIGKRFSPRYAIVWVVMVGLMVSAIFGQFNINTMLQHASFQLAMPEAIRPEFSWYATLNLALPLVLLNLTGQFLPGMALLKLNNYHVSSRPILNTASVASLAIAPFGGISIVQAAVTATLCMGKECHDNPSQRYIGGVSTGLFYLLGAMFAGSLVGLFQSLPSAFVACLAGLALLGALLNNLSLSMQHAEQKEPALLTFLVTVSGMSLLGIGSVFWGIVIGMCSYLLFNAKLTGEQRND